MLTNDALQQAQQIKKHAMWQILQKKQLSRWNLHYLNVFIAFRGYHEAAHFIEREGVEFGALHLLGQLPEISELTFWKCFAHKKWGLFYSLFMSAS